MLCLFAGVVLSCVNFILLELFVGWLLSVCLVVVLNALGGCVVV